MVRVTTGYDQAMGGSRKVRVAVVDDLADVRLLLRVLFETDARFEVVGEARNGVEAIELAERMAPDVIVLDRQMPVMGGVEALPEIRRRAPRAAVVLYTAGADANTAQAALAAGALQVIDKTDSPSSFVDDLADVLLGHWAGPGADVDIRVGPVTSGAARAWVANTSEILAAIRAHPEVLDEPVPDDVLELFETFLVEWGEVAADTEVFRWAARADVARVQRLVEHWAAVDRMSDEQLAVLGVQWSPPEARPFFLALTAGVLEAVAAREEMRQLADTLAGQWPNAAEDLRSANGA
jgi:CheY-like chemotaxis protein